MYDSLRTFVAALGGYREVARRLQMGGTTMHGYLMAGKLPAKWYEACIDLAQERHLEAPSRRLFSFEALPQPIDEAPAEDAA